MVAVALAVVAVLTVGQEVRVVAARAVALQRLPLERLT
jgi:hypothetical protein